MVKNRHIYNVIIMLLYFSVAGLYKVEYYANNGDGKEVSKVVQVLIKAGNLIPDQTETLYLSVTDFIIKNSEAKELSKDSVKDGTHGKAQAYKVDKDAQGNITEIKDVTDQVTVNVDQLNAVKNTSSSGGIYDLTFDIKSDNLKTSKGVKVVVEGTNTPEPIDGLAITANDFELTYDEALKLDANMAKDKSQVEAYLLDNLLETNTGIEISVSEEQMNQIKKVTKTGGVFDLNFTATYTDGDGNIKSIVTTVKVTVKGTSKEITTTETTTTNNVLSNNTKLPKTGNNSNLIVISALLLGAGINLFIIAKKESNRKSNNSSLLVLDIGIDVFIN